MKDIKFWLNFIQIPSSQPFEDQKSLNIVIKNSKGNK